MINTREDLARYFYDQGYKVGAEIGVLGGDYSALLCRSIPGLKLYCIDAWGIGERKRRDYHLNQYEVAKIILAPYDTTLIHKLSTDAVVDFEDDSLDFVYIDANHEPSFVADDIAEWTKKVRKGGIVSGHDYAPRISKVIDDYVKINNQDLQLTTLESENISWWFIKK